jgi:biopolymer transport protein ExbB
MATKNAATKKSNVIGVKSPIWVILLCAVAGFCFYQFVCGAPHRFSEGDPVNGHPLNGDLLATVYKGGFIVPILMTCLLTVIVLSVERFIAMWSANGKGNTTKFIAGVKAALENNDLAKAKELCAKKQGVVASVVASAIIKYEQVENDETLTKEKKVEAIQKQLEEATALEMPALQQNLPIIATLTTLGTLVGLLGTVMGMIKSFAALASGDGAADSQALSTGISEALVNTATGIATGAFAVISYNYYSNKIDTLTYAIDEIGFCIVNAFNKTH